MAVSGEEPRDLNSILSGDGRDFLIRNNGDQVKITELSTKVVGLYFSASWWGACGRFTLKLVETYTDLASKGRNFEVVFISADVDVDSFSRYFSEMPWLAIPFSGSITRDHLSKLFMVRRMPQLVILDGSGKILTNEGVQFVGDYGLEGYPFTPERIEMLKEDEEAAKMEQTLRSLLVSSSRDFLISSNGNEVPISYLEGKLVGLYFSLSSFWWCREFTPILAEMYTKLKDRGESFEVVLVSLDEEQSSFELDFAGMPWLAIPFRDKKSRDRLVRYFYLETVPMLVVIGSDGKTVHKSAADLVEEHGIEAYPFTLEKLEQFAEKEKVKLEVQTLESLLVSGEHDYVIGKGGAKVPISDLVGKSILLYFSAHWCPPCRVFLPKLCELYQWLKFLETNQWSEEKVEVIFISSDWDLSSFDKFFSGMPWLALPFGDKRNKSLARTFNIHCIPSLVAIGSTGKTITKEAWDLVMAHGRDTYPFTDERMKELAAEIDDVEIKDMAKGWPEKGTYSLHEEHELTGTRREAYTCGRCECEEGLVLTHREGYICDGCNKGGHGWSFYCDLCDFDLHPKCALEQED